MTDMLMVDVTRVVQDPLRGLPNELYTTDAGLALEARTVFATGWACLGFAHDVPRAGDVAPIDFVGQPLIMLRDRENRVRVFHNVCSHRGVVLVEEAGNCKGVIRCPYHSWCYDLNGALRRTPFVGGPNVDAIDGFDRSQHGLREVRSHVWMGLVLINLDGNAPDFELMHQRLIDRWADFAAAPLTHVQGDSTLEFDLAANWKLPVENYCEAYHLPWVHPGLNTYSRLEDHEAINEPGLYAGQVSLVYNPILSPDGTAFPPLSGLPAYWETRAEYVALFPNVLLGIHKDHYFAVLIQPAGPKTVHERMEIFYFSPEVAGPDYAALREANLRTWRTVFAEDVGVVEAMQRGRSSTGFDGGVLTPMMDAPTRCFHEWVAGRVLAPPEERAESA